MISSSASLINEGRVVRSYLFVGAVFGRGAFGVGFFCHVLCVPPTRDSTFEYFSDRHRAFTGVGDV